VEYGYIITGFVVGLLVGLTGVGGGSLMTPILLIVFNVKPLVAIGTDLLFAAITKSTGILAHRKLGNIDWTIVIRLAIGSIPAALATLWAISQFDTDSAQTVATIKRWLGFALIITSMAVLFRDRLFNLVNGKQWFSPMMTRLITTLLGVLLGVLVTITSVGAGALGLTCLVLLYPKHKISTLVGTDIAHAVPLTLIAGLGHASLGTVDYSLLGYLLIGSIPGIYLGSHMSTKMAEHWLRIILAAILIFVGSKLVLH